jgi:hypothetical protein
LRRDAAAGNEAGGDLGARSRLAASPHFEAEARRQSRLAAEAPDEQEIMDFIEQVSAWDDEDPRAKG